MPLRLAVFDFDQTLSACHVYYALAGGDGGLWVPPPYARTERGQLARLIELDASAEYSAQGGFAIVAFGGQERVARLQCFFEELRSFGIECVVCSRGLVGPIQRCLDQVGLLGFTTHVYANVDSGSYSSNATEYDQYLQPGVLGKHARFMGTSANSGWGSKKQLVARCLRERGLQANEAFFIDDTQSEIDNVQGTCATILVQPPQGMATREMELIRRLLPGGGSSGEVANSNSTLLTPPRHGGSGMPAGASPDKSGHPFSSMTKALREESSSKLQGPLPSSFLQQLHPPSGGHGKEKFPFYVTKADQKFQDEDAMGGHATSPPDRLQYDTGDAANSPVSLRCKKNRSRSPVAQTSELQQQLDWQHSQQQQDVPPQDSPLSVERKHTSQYAKQQSDYRDMRESGDPHDRRRADKWGSSEPPMLPPPPPLPRRSSEQDTYGGGQGDRQGGGHGNGRCAGGHVSQSPRATPTRGGREEQRPEQRPSPFDNRSGARGSRHQALPASNSAGAASDVGLLASTSAGAASAYSACSVATTPRSRPAVQFRPSATDQRALSAGRYSTGGGWLPHEGTTQDDGPMTPVCCWLQGAMPSDGRAGPPLCAVQ